MLMASMCHAGQEESGGIAGVYNRTLGKFCACDCHGDEGEELVRAAAAAGNRAAVCNECVVGCYRSIKRPSKEAFLRN